MVKENKTNINKTSKPAKKQGKQSKYCTPNCFYFPQEPNEILSEEIIDGILHRKVIRCCRYDGKQIENWEHKCPRKKSKKGK